MIQKFNNDARYHQGRARRESGTGEHRDRARRHNLKPLRPGEEPSVTVGPKAGVPVERGDGENTVISIM